jgi:hypothetical protein
MVLTRRGDAGSCGAVPQWHLAVSILQNGGIGKSEIDREDNAAFCGLLSASRSRLQTQVFTEVLM